LLRRGLAESPEKNLSIQTLCSSFRWACRIEQRRFPEGAGRSTRRRPRILFFYAGSLGGFLVRFLREAIRFGGVLHGLAGMLVGAQVVFVAMMEGGSAVRMGRQIMQLGGFLM
jgi:hypothetical protein